MSATRYSVNEIELLVDRHVGLCEIYGGMADHGRREPPVLSTMSEGKAASQCLADLADLTLTAYASQGMVKDSALYSLKAVLAEAIVAMAL
jgi:hypothetical protein